MASPGRSSCSSSKDIDYPVFQNVDPRWCGREESILLDAIEVFGYGNWEFIADLFKFECADKNFTVQDIIDHCNLIFGKNALGAVWDSKAISERKTFLCDHTGPEDDAFVNSSDINAAKNLTQEQLDSIGYMPLREDFREVKEPEIATLIPEIRLKERYLQELYVRKHTTDEVEEDIELMLDRYDSEGDDGDDTEDEDDDEVEEGDKEMENLKEEDLTAEKGETERVEKLELETVKEKTALSIKEEVNCVRTRSSTLKDFKSRKVKPLERLSKSLKEDEKIEDKKPIHKFGKELRNTKKHIDNKQAKGEEKRMVKKNEEKLRGMAVVERLEGRKNRRNAKGKEQENFICETVQSEESDEKVQRKVLVEDTREKRNRKSIKGKVICETELREKMEESEEEVQGMIVVEKIKGKRNRRNVKGKVADKVMQENVISKVKQRVKMEEIDEKVQEMMVVEETKEKRNTRNVKGRMGDKRVLENVICESDLKKEIAESEGKVQGMVLVERSWGKRNRRNIKEKLSDSRVEENVIRNIKQKKERGKSEEKVQGIVVVEKPKERRTRRNIREKVADKILQENIICKTEQKEEVEEKVQGIVLIEKRNRRNVRENVADEIVQENIVFKTEWKEEMEDIKEKKVTGGQLVVKSSPKEKESKRKGKGETERNENWTEEYPMEEVDCYDGTTEEEADDEDTDVESISGLRDGTLITGNDGRDGKVEQPWHVDGNMMITEILVEAVDMYCKEMREKALTNRLISCHRLVEHYFKYGKKQKRTKKQQKGKNKKPVDLRDESCVYGMLKTFAQFLEPESLENFLVDFREENRLRAKIDDLHRDLEKPDYAVYHLSSVNSDEEDGVFG